jgi:predicted double-glycine peptidase
MAPKEMRPILFFALCTLSWGAFAFDRSQANRIASEIKVKSWKHLRDNKIVKQQYDFSCGASSLATILSEFYFDQKTEKEVLDLISSKKGAVEASFYDMSVGLQKIGYKGVGYATSYEQLLNLKIPVVVYVEHRKTNHFSVLRGIQKSSVLMSDPSLGHITYSKEQFMKIWKTREGRLVGKVFVIVPEDSTKMQNKEYFKKRFLRQTAQAVRNFESNQLILN